MNCTQTVSRVRSAHSGPSTSGMRAPLGLKRGLAGALAQTERPHNHVVADAMLVTFLASLLGAAILIAVPQAMFPNSSINGLDRLLALVVIGVAGSDVALAQVRLARNAERTLKP